MVDELMKIYDADRNTEVRAEYGHLHLGFQPAELRRMSARAGLRVDRIVSAGREKRAPHFEALALMATKETGRNGGDGARPSGRRS